MRKSHMRSSTLSWILLSKVRNAYNQLVGVRRRFNLSRGARQSTFISISRPGLRLALLNCIVLRYHRRKDRGDPSTLMRLAFSRSLRDLTNKSQNAPFKTEDRNKKQKLIDLRWTFLMTSRICSLALRFCGASPISSSICITTLARLGFCLQIRGEHFSNI